MNKIEWYNKVAKCIQDNLEQFYSQFYPGQLTKVGSDYRLEPCPRCGHRGCCTVGAALHCFSCKWSGTHINAFKDLTKEIQGKPASEAIKALVHFSNTPYPQERAATKEEEEEAERRENNLAIAAIAVDFYHHKLITTQVTYQSQGAAKLLTPLQYQMEVRKHNINSLKSFKVGFSKDYTELYQHLLEKGFTKEQVKSAKAWVPDGVFVYPYHHPVTRDVLRLNVKNPFLATMPDKADPTKFNVIQGFSTGEKVLGFAPGFSFKKPALIVEGENDAITCFEQGFHNVCWAGGTIKQEQLNALEQLQDTLYCCFDHDAAGENYIRVVDQALPHKDVRAVLFDESFNDIDDYYRKCPEPASLQDLLARAESIETEAFKISQEGGIWTIQNRHKRLDFKVEGKDSKSTPIGKIDFYVGGVLKDREDDKPLSKARAKMRPFNYYLADYMDEYFNVKLEERTFTELLGIYRYCVHKSQVLKLLAKEVYRSKVSEELVQSIKIALGDDACDAILKEVNDLQNTAITSFASIPKIKLTQYFNCRNNDGYMYFTNIKQDGETIRKLPFLLRNDKQLIRLDLLKRKDSQCLLLVDNKYELPFEVSEAIMDTNEVSLTQDWVVKYCADEVTPEQLNVYRIIKEIESYLRRFYFHPHDNVYKVLALFIYGTYYYELFLQYPYLFLNGDKGSGKSALGTVLYMFCLNAKYAVNISEASLFRLIALEGGTIILDEMENLVSRNKNAESTMSTILKGGYSSGGQKVYRFNPEKNTSEGFPPYSPKIICNITGMEDVIEDRCIRIDTHAIQIGRDRKIEDPKKYLLERLDEIRDITSRCCLSALENFQLMNRIFEGDCFSTTNARLSQILTPVYAVAKMADLSAKYMRPTLDVPLEGIRGEYMKAFEEFYSTTVTSSKREVEDSSRNGVVKAVIKSVALELANVIPSNKKDLTIPSNHKYKEAITYNKEEGWFELNIIHIKCFTEEHTPGEVHQMRELHKAVKAGYQLDIVAASRKIANLDGSDDLIKEFGGNHKPKVYYYRFRIADFVNNGFLQSEQQVAAATSHADVQSRLF